MTSVSKNVFIDKLADKLANKYNNTYHGLIKMKPIDVKSSTYIDLNKESNKKDPEFKVVDHVRISKFENIFEKACVPSRVIVKC